LRSDIKKPVWHNSLRLPSGERLSTDKLVEICDDYMRRMGFYDMHLRAYVLHDDAQGQHIHIVASRVALDSTLYLGRNENLKSTRHIQQLEREYNLTITQGPIFDNTGKIIMPDKRQPTKKELERAVRTGHEPPRQMLHRLVDDALAFGPQTAPEFRCRLESLGVTVRPNVAKTGRLNGFSFGVDGIFFTGAKLGNGYKWASLQKRGVSYDVARDMGALIGQAPVQTADRPTVEDGVDRLITRTRNASEAQFGQLVPAELPRDRAIDRDRWRPNTTLVLAFRAGDHGRYRWSGFDRVAFVDHGDHIRIHSQSNTAIKAALQLGRCKWGNKIRVTGSLVYRQKAWLQGCLLGLEISGYKPSARDQQQLAALIAERDARLEARRAERAAVSVAEGKAHTAELNSAAKEYQKIEDAKHHEQGKDPDWLDEILYTSPTELKHSPPLADTSNSTSPPAEELKVNDGGLDVLDAGNADVKVNEALDNTQDGYEQSRSSPTMEM
jgi:hypothetical protein